MMCFSFFLLLMVASLLRRADTSTSSSTATSCSFVYPFLPNRAAMQPAIRRIRLSQLYLTASKLPTQLRNNNERLTLFSEKNGDPPYLALVTERTSCDSRQHMEKAFQAIQQAVSTDEIDLVYVRVTPHDPEESDQSELLVELVQQILALDGSFRVVVSSDWIDAAVTARARGIHFKETHRHLIKLAREKFRKVNNYEPVIGTSCHSVESGIQGWNQYQPDYFFVGTCYLTESHPEKTQEELEGPELPSIVRQAVLHERHVHKQEKNTRMPVVFAIGGIDGTNCREPLYQENGGADGIAVIRSILAAPDPAYAVGQLQKAMKLEK